MENRRHRSILLPMRAKAHLAASDRRKSSPQGLLGKRAGREKLPQITVAPGLAAVTAELESAERLSIDQRPRDLRRLI